MISQFGSLQFGNDGYISSNRVGRYYSIAGDQSNHGGTILNTNQDGTVLFDNNIICVEGSQHSCPIPGHGTTPITAVAIKTYINGKLIITQGALAGCGAKINAYPGRTVTVE